MSQGNPKGTRTKKIDRSGNMYSESDFLNMTPQKQLELANKYLGKNIQKFDEDQLFRFSYTHFAHLCLDVLGFEKRIVGSKESDIIVIEVERNYKTSVEKKFTISKDTAQEIQQFTETIPNENVRVKSHIIDAIIFEAFNRINNAIYENRRVCVIEKGTDNRVIR